MKTWVDDVREQLQSLKRDCEECGAPDDVEITGGYGLDIGLVWELCNEALATIPDEDPMVVLLRWIYDELETPKDWAQERGYFQVIKRIEEMGYKLEEGE